MANKFLTQLSLCLAIALSSNVAFAQDLKGISESLREKAEGNTELSNYVAGLERQIERNRQGKSLENLLHLLYGAAPDGKLKLSSVALLEAKELARYRASAIARYLIFDVNGDGVISEAEKKNFFGKDAATLEVLFSTGDTNENDKLEFVEISSVAESSVKESKRTSRFQPLTLFDLDGDGIVLAADISITLKALEKFPLKMKVVRDRVKLRPSKDVSKCAAPQPDDRAQIMVLSGYEGSALSTTSIAGLDEVTQVARVGIESGTAPVYLFLSSYSNIIWQISGNTERLQKVVIEKGYDGGAGVVGVDKSKIHFIEAGSCLGYVTNLKGGKGILALGKMARHLGREPDHMSAYYTIGSISLPSGKGAPKVTGGEGTDIIVYDGKRYTLTPKGPKLLDEDEGHGFGSGDYGIGQTSRSLFRFHPDGVIEIDPSDVVGSGEVAKYDVMPQEAGLLQLLLEKKINYTRDRYYVIEKQIERFPAGLAGAHSVKFILGKGVEMPKGSPSHSSVYSKETGKCLTQQCR